MKYDNATTSGSIPGTRDFGVPDIASRARNRVDKHHAHNGNEGDKNGRSMMFTITIDPQGLYTLGVSQFTQYAVASGIHLGTFTEGTEWMSPTGRVRIIKGKLRYTRSRKIYKLPEIREGKIKDEPNDATRYVLQPADD